MIGNKLFDYEITRKIKAGGMGVVYEARRVWGRRERVAVKFLLEQLRDDDNIRRRFIREAEILENLSHPRIVKILGLDPDRDAFVMEYVEGRTLSDHLRNNPQVYHDPKVAVEMFAQLLDAFDYAHHVVIEIGARREQGVIHRDIKPSNIIIEPDGCPKILDFGISRISTFESTLTDPKLQMGSVAYMSPEQIVNPAGVDWRSDIYALGVNLWELFAGRSPYPYVTSFDVVIQVQNSIRNEALPLLAELMADADPEQRAFLGRVDAVIAKATAKEPALRYQRCGEMRNALLETLLPLSITEPVSSGVAEPLATPEPIAATEPISPSAESPADTPEYASAQPDYVDVFPQPVETDWLNGDSATRIREFEPVVDYAAVESPVVAAQTPLTPDGSFRPVVDPDAVAARRTKPPGGSLMDRLKGAPRSLVFLAIGLALLVGGIIWWQQNQHTPIDNTVSQASVGLVASDSAMVSMTKADSCYTVGFNYHHGRNGIAKDYTQAAYWYRKAADLRNSNAQSALGYMYQSGQGLNKDYAEALKLFQVSADQGNAEGQKNLGYMYFQGYGVKQNYTEALKWFRAAAEQGNIEARNDLGVMYDNGMGVAENNAEALKWYLRAANENSAIAQFYVGTMYQLGEGVEQNDGKAIQWYRLAARQKEPGALKGASQAQKALRQLNQTW